MKHFVRRCLCVLCMTALSTGALAHTQSDAPPVDLLEVDHKLYEYGYRDANCNGEMDEVTISALINFQTVNGLEVTGTADEETVELLMYGTPITAQEYLADLARRYNEAAVLSLGSEGAAVEKLQRALRDYGYFSGDCDGKFGDTTAAAVYRFQTANGLERTSVAAGSVFVRLYEGKPVRWDEYVSASCAEVGSIGANVRQIQLRLKYMGYFTGECTGKFGEATQQAVQYFQENNGLEASGAVDMPTYECLFSDQAVTLKDSASLRRGDAGSTTASVCARLMELGYPADAEFDYRTELAVMIFQQNYGMDITGVVDEKMQTLLLSEDAPRMEDVQQIMDIEIYGEIFNQFYRVAADMLGKQAKFEDCFEFVQYVYLRCGVGLLDESQFRLEQLERSDRADIGEVLVLEIGGDRLCGISGGDGTVIYCQPGGYVVTGYLAMLGADVVYRWDSGVFL